MPKVAAKKTTKKTPAAVVTETTEAEPVTHASLQKRSAAILLNAGAADDLVRNLRFELLHGVTESAGIMSLYGGDKAMTAQKWLEVQSEILAVLGIVENLDQEMFGILEESKSLAADLARVAS